MAGVRTLNESEDWRKKAMSDAKDALACGDGEAAWCALNRHEPNHSCKVCVEGAPLVEDESGILQGHDGFRIGDDVEMLSGVGAVVSGIDPEGWIIVRVRKNGEHRRVGPETLTRVESTTPAPKPDPQCSGPGYAHAPHGNCMGYGTDRT